MKTLILVRHAKSSWGTFSTTDEERPLNDRGRKNASEMARRLKKKLRIDAFMSSPAVRARTTAEYFAEAYGLGKRSILLVPELYMAKQDDFVRTIRNAPSGAGTIAIFSHNNGITDFANNLSTAKIDHMPTCSVFAVKCNINDWLKFETGNNEFYFFDFPKSV